MKNLKRILVQTNIPRRLVQTVLMRQLDMFRKVKRELNQRLVGTSY